MGENFSFQTLARYSLAYAFLAFLFFVGLVSLSIPMTESVRPYFFLMAVYYWAIYRPSLMPSFVIFASGLLYDLVLGFPVGLHAVLFLSVYLIIKNQRSFFLGQSYFIGWLGFLMTCLSVQMIEYLFFSLRLGSVLSLFPLVGNFLISALFFPLISLIFILLNRILPLAPKSIISVD